MKSRYDVSKRFGRRLVLASGGVAALAGCVWGLSAVFGEGELSVGDCLPYDGTAFAMMAEREALASEAVDCSQEHGTEVFHVETLPSGEYPGMRELMNTAAQTCEGGTFEDFVGTEYHRSELYASVSIPSATLWEEQGDRSLYCVAHAPGGNVTGSLEDANR